MADLIAQGAAIQRQIAALRRRYAFARAARLSLIPSWGIA
ncbi:hypothetical protein FHY06_005719 [Variovorax sp. BK613]|nr:hypothetical protein [Variovorax sp. BK613]